ncbi:alpha/beta hydrolase [Streptomyces olivaceoviridis]|uniref:alpha/beta hydrolase n=1 Tax=Streptomyces olivaceoviridis TaxID=1921 RepID=UPI0027E4E9BA|nr:alpha/beta hydrolase fold domain-containing protein [Streptomyces olivaceoviridis]
MSFDPADQPAQVEACDITVPGPEGAPEVGVRVYTPESQGRKLPGLLYVHGGGFALGSVDGFHNETLRIAAEVGAVVVSVEYRLAPEHPFPAALEDCYAALIWLAEHADELGVDPERIGVAGESAGGGLAAGVALYARDHGGPALSMQYLGIPVLDDRLETTSMHTFVDVPLRPAPDRRGSSHRTAPLPGNVPRCEPDGPRVRGEPANGRRGDRRAPPRAAPSLRRGRAWHERRARHATAPGAGARSRLNALRRAEHPHSALDDRVVGYRAIHPPPSRPVIRRPSHLARPPLPETARPASGGTHHGQSSARQDRTHHRVHQQHRPWGRDRVRPGGRACRRLRP